MLVLCSFDRLIRPIKNIKTCASRQEIKLKFTLSINFTSVIIQQALFNYFWLQLGGNCTVQSGMSVMLPVKNKICGIYLHEA